ncbi:hypothetical protein LC653_08150 [Nostoc sp. CHAB 5784]|uniref:hypothetical protein n=1 Tax=Nostoc mirabile TaxID=2907820 RepID=UPI001E4ACBF1|nr:hypothetical protein [Nostoc mirabile]MCC5663895.1 hypothetical protein [Nostoc mirabile CHAB5784]
MLIYAGTSIWGCKPESAMGFATFNCKGISPAHTGSEFILGYAELNEQQIQEGVRRLAQVILGA